MPLRSGVPRPVPMYAQGMSGAMVQAVVVLYKTTMQESATLHSLDTIFAAQPELAERVDLLVYDNSPEPHPPANEQTGAAHLIYRHDSSNRGLAGAYNVALDLARQKQLQWLLLLDQDTTLTSEYLHSLFERIVAEPPSEACAIVPRQVRDGVLLSPRLIRRGRELPVPDGLATEPLTVFNSAACVRVSSLLAIGGFPREFPLDYLDHVVFHRLQAKAGGRLWVMPIRIEHQLSIKNLAEEMSLERYRRLLVAEWGYIGEVKPKGGTPVQRVRLLQRALAQAKMKDRRFARETLAAALNGPPRS